jgi:ParB family chromosome partitioning protein
LDDDQTTEGADHSDATPTAFKKATSGAGSAWKAGAIAQAQGDLDDAREKLASDILSGSHVIEIDPGMLTDPIGSDRRDDWMEQADFLSFVESIRENGQDMPILVWPEDLDWRPDDIDPENLERVQFLLLAGRRRREAARKLGRPVRAVIASQDGRGGAEATFNMLVMRFRENDEREDLSAFERLLSIGQMYEELTATTDIKIKAKEFAERIGVHESIVSRARAVFRAKSEFLNAFKNVYDMSFRELQEALAKLTGEQSAKAKTTLKPKKLTITRKVGSRKLLVSSQGGKLSVNAAGLNLDKAGLEGLGDVIATYLQEQEPKA